jgi:signal peptidase II
VSQLIEIVVLVLIDRGIKNLAAANLQGQDTKVLIKGFLGLMYAENTGAAFSMFNTSTNALSVVTGVLMAAGLVALFLVKKKPVIYDICVPLVIAGGMGNLVDRLTRGYVIDYIRTLFIDFPIFNFADILITCACFALIIYLIYDMVKDAKNAKNKKAENGEKES